MEMPVIDMESCVLCDICMELAPHVFYHNDLDYIEVLDRDDYSDESVHDAINNCPRHCITLE